MSKNLEKLKRLLAELFQLDQADLDFGIYRIMNQKRDEIQRFLNHDLLPQVQEAFEGYQSTDKSRIKAELDKAIENALALGFEPDSAPRVRELQAQYGQAFDPSALENEVFSDLYHFFRRYYHEGDFLSLRRYREGVYAIPYEGEEVKLYWANHDQYYVKSSEYFRDYTFKLSSGKRVHFKLVEADTEKDNNHAASGQERRFILCEDDPLVEANGELFIRFEYRPDKRKQKALNEQAIQTLLNAEGFGTWLTELSQPTPTEANPRRTLLEKHLTDDTARNTFDYFIHKDLGGFLRRELDFYIKNEIMHLDDIDEETAPRVEQYLSKIKVIRKMAHQIIAFLEQLENFQKKLWLKKKFVVETNYCVTLDRVPAELYPEIAANDAQREEWVRLFAIDEIDGDLISPRYSEPLTVDFLLANPHLVLDTQFFDPSFKDRLLSSFDNLDEQTDGLLVHGENFQALNLLQERYRKKGKCVYIDPPYNTGGDGFVYKDNYQHGCWLNMIADRLALAKESMNEEGVIFIHIDENEQFRLRMLLEIEFGGENYLAPLIWISRAGKGGTATQIQIGHEHIESAAKNFAKVSLKTVEKVVDKCPYQDEKGRYKRELLRQWGGQHDRREDRPTLYFPIPTPFGIEVYPKRRDGTDGNWRFSREKVMRMLEIDDLDFVLDENTGEITVYRKIREGRKVVSVPSNLLDDVGTSADGTKDIQSLFGEKVFDTTKPSRLAQRLIELVSWQTENSDLILDFFAGSGTTAHAVINLNREDGGNRKYLLVEMANYFDTVMKPRIKKGIYSTDWKEGKPVSRQGSSHIFKDIRLESYEDTLNNLELKRTDTQQSLLDSAPAFREDYMLSYMLSVESRGSASLLNIDAFVDPFGYQLNIGTGSAGETKPVTVDVVETFNYLLGLRVKHIDRIRGFYVIEGTNPNDEKVLVIWRSLLEKSNADLEEFFQRQNYNTRDQEFLLIYVNGDNNLENLRRDDQTWKVRLIEEEFQRLMFDVQDV